MKRRDFITLLGGAVTWPLAVRAQQPPKISRVGIIDDSPNWNAFRQGLRDLGYLEGQNIAFEYRYGDGLPDRLAEVAADLVRRPVSVIVANTPANLVAKAATTSVWPLGKLEPQYHSVSHSAGRARPTAVLTT